MHELTITQSILDIAVRHATQAEAARVTHVYLVIGAFSSIVDDSVQFYWDFVSEGTLAAGATLHFRRIPGRLQCAACSHTFAPDGDLACPQCAGEQLDVVSGNEFYLEAIDVEETPLPAGTPPPAGVTP